MKWKLTDYNRTIQIYKRKRTHEMAQEMDFILKKKSRTHLITHSETQLKCKTGSRNIGYAGLKERERNM